MEKKQSKKSAWILVLLMLGAFTLAFQLGAVGALAQDDDKDGLPETGPIDLSNTGLSLAAYPGLSLIPLCVSGIPRDECVTDTSQDLFVIIQRANGVCPASSCVDLCGPVLLFTNPNSDFPMPLQPAPTYNPLEWVPGLATGFTTHELIQVPPYTSQAIGGWWAVKVVEKLDPCSSYMGFATFKVPWAPGGIATVWPEKIMNWVDNTCNQACFDENKDGIAEKCYTPATTSGTFYCTNSNNSNAKIDMKATPPDLRPLYYDLIKNVANHEVSHLLNLASGSGTSADHHWPIAQGILMEQFIGTKVTKDRSNNIVVTLYISTGYNKQDKAAYRLK